MKKIKFNFDKLKKGKFTMAVTIGIACLALAAVTFMQFKIVNQTDITSIETMRETELRTELATWKEKYDETNKKYEETMEKIAEYKNNEKSSSESEELLNKELQQTKMILGTTDVQGQGIIVTLKDENNQNDTPIKADDLLVIVNQLKLAGAEAISINDQRIINMSDIVYINNSFIKVNQQRILSPYAIKAIGNQSYLESALVGSGGHVDDLKKLGHNVQIEKNDKILINKYEGDLSIKYME